MKFQIKLSKGQERALKYALYSACAGFFGIFCRWMQDMVCFDENGLPETGFWTFAVPLLCIAAAVVFSRFVNQLRDKRYYISSSSEDFPLKNDSSLFKFIRILLCLLMCAGALILFMESEVDKNISWLRVVSVLSFLSGICIFFFFSTANRPKDEIPMGLMCLYSFLPILLYCVWLLTLYKINSINSIVAAYGIDIIAVCFIAIAYYRIAGFAFGSPNVWRTLFFSMFSAFMAISVIPDAEYLGVQIMLGASAGTFLLTVWILIVNMKCKDPLPKVQPVDGFDRIIPPSYRGPIEEPDEEDEKKEAGDPLADLLPADEEHLEEDLFSRFFGR